MKHNYEYFKPYENKCTGYSNGMLLYYILLKISKDRLPNSKYTSLYSLNNNNNTTILYEDTIFVVDEQDVKVIQDLAYKLDEEIQTNKPWLIVEN